MKSVLPFVLIVASLAVGGNSNTQQMTRSQTEIPDAVTADNTHYKVEFENEFVRTLRIHYGPHERGYMHNHPHSTTVFLTDGKLRMTFPDGKTVMGTVKKGQVVWEEAGPHQPENLTDEPFEAVRIELKK